VTYNAPEYFPKTLVPKQNKNQTNKNTHTHNNNNNNNNNNELKSDSIYKN